MKNLKILIPFLLIWMAFNAACSSTRDNSGQLYSYKPDDQKLHDTIISLDSAFFAAYNTCAVNLEKHASFYADSIEFYHDKTGLMSSRQDLIEAIKTNICGKVTRELVQGSIEVYPIHNYGAVEMGLHKFHNNTDKSGTPSRTGKFIIFWQNKNNEWKITKVVSLH